MQPLTWNADQEVINGKRRRTRFGVKHRNYLDSDNKWKKIDAQFQQVGNLFQVSHAPYKLECPRLANGDFRFDATTRYDIHSKQLIGSNPSGVTKRFPGVQPIEGIVSGFDILYPLAAPALVADVLVHTHEQKVQYLYQWRSLPPGDSEFVECPVEFEFDDVPSLARKSGSRTIRTTDQSITEALTLVSNTNRGVSIKPARVWDSLNRSAPVALRLRRIGKRLVGVKLVPRSFLQKAFADGAFWVRTDTTSTFYPDADPESTTTDGTFFMGSADTNGDFFSTIIGYSSSTSIYDNLSSDYVLYLYASSSGNDNLWQYIYRAAFLFDTSSIPDTDVISAADFILTATTGGGVTDDFGSTISLQPCDISVDSALDVYDYGRFRNNTTLLGSLAVSSWNGSEGVANTITLNTAGKNFISKTGVTQIGVVNEADRSSTEPTWVENGSLGMYCYYADESGTTKDPALEVTHDVPPASSMANSVALLSGVG